MSVLTNYDIDRNQRAGDREPGTFQLLLTSLSPLLAPLLLQHNIKPESLQALVAGGGRLESQEGLRGCPLSTTKTSFHFLLNEAKVVKYKHADSSNNKTSGISNLLSTFQSTKPPAELLIFSSLDF